MLHKKGLSQFFAARMPWAARLLLGTLCAVLAFNSHASFSLQTTRVIHHEKERASQVTVSSSGESNYLVQSWVENRQEQQSNDFVTIPPLFKLNGGDQNAIQIIRNVELPGNQETLYWLNVKFVAPSQQDAVDVLRYSVTKKIKLIYRPESLRDVRLSEEVQRLAFSLEAGQLKVVNPTGVYVNLNGIYLNGVSLPNPGYFAPNSTSHIVLESPPAAGSGEVRVNYINDYGSSLNTTFGLVDDR